MDTNNTVVPINKEAQLRETVKEMEEVDIFLKQQNRDSVLGFINYLVWLGAAIFGIYIVLSSVGDFIQQVVIR